MTNLRITENQLRKIIAEEIKAVTEAETPASVGKDIKGGAAAQTAGEKVVSNPAIKSAIDKITTADGLAAFLQDILAAASEKGIDQQEAVKALTKVISAVKLAK